MCVNILDCYGNFWTKMLAPGGIEPTTFALLARRSNQLSYGAIVRGGAIFLFVFFLPNVLHAV